MKFKFKKIMSVHLMKNCRPKLVTFDVTGTLLNTKIKEHYCDIGEKHNIPINNPDLLSTSFKKHFQRLSIEHPAFGKNTGLGWRNWWRCVVHDVFNDQNNNKISADKLDQAVESLIALYSTEICWQKYPETDNLLQYLNDKNVIVGVISNFDERLEEILINTDIKKYFSFVLTSWLCGRDKPDPKIFQEAIKIAGTINSTIIKPEEIIHIGDNLKLDYHAAKKIGWNSYLINHNYHLELNDLKTPPEVQIFRNHRELKKHFEKILN